MKRSKKVLAETVISELAADPPLSAPVPIAPRQRLAATRERYGPEWGLKGLPPFRGVSPAPWKPYTDDDLRRIYGPRHDDPPSTDEQG